MIHRFEIWRRAQLDKYASTSWFSQDGRGIYCENPPLIINVLGFAHTSSYPVSAHSISSPWQKGGAFSL